MVPPAFARDPVHYVDTIILPLLFSVFLIALFRLGWKDIQIERQRRKVEDRREEPHPVPPEPGPEGASKGKPADTRAEDTSH